MVHSAALTLLSLSLSAAPGCPDGGETLFLKADRGFQGYRLIGGDSYRSFFAGKALERASAGKPAAGGRAEFWVDDVLAQWMLVGREAFMEVVPKSEWQLLHAFHEFQSGAVAGIEREPQPLEQKAGDGKPRLFDVWSAALGKASEATQFWVATPHPRGVVVLTVIAPSADAIPKARAVIDAYMANYGPIDAAACKRFRDGAGTAR